MKSSEDGLFRRETGKQLAARSQAPGRTGRSTGRSRLRVREIRLPAIGAQGAVTVVRVFL